MTIRDYEQAKEIKRNIEERENMLKKIEDAKFLARDLEYINISITRVPLRANDTKNIGNSEQEFYNYLNIVEANLIKEIAMLTIEFQNI